jgi:hypothetical protein
MISLETLRQALLSADPFSELDRLVRVELGAGRTTQQVFDDLNPMIDVVLATLGVTEDGEEALFGALDTLSGNCHPDCEYRDLPRDAQPTRAQKPPANL